MQAPTIKIKHPDGFAIINECDFDPKIHERFDTAKDREAINSEMLADMGLRVKKRGRKKATK